jgi:hypothetical protein
LRFFDEGLQEQWETHVNAHERAVRERENAMRTMEASLRAAHNGAMQLLVQEAAGVLELERALDELDSIQRQLSMGRVTPFELENALVTVSSRELSLQSIRLQLWGMW